MQGKCAKVSEIVLTHAYTMETFMAVFVVTFSPDADNVDGPKYVYQPLSSAAVAALIYPNFLSIFGINFIYSTVRLSVL